MVFQLQRVVFSMRIFLSIIFIITTTLISVEQAEAACAADGSGVITVVEKNHGRSSSDIVRFRNIVGFDGFTTAVLEKADGYSITKVDDNTYTFSASSGTSLVGSINGGGRNATAGPVTLGA